MKDMAGRTLAEGDTILYAGRSGSSLWMIRAKVMDIKSYKAGWTMQDDAAETATVKPDLDSFWHGDMNAKPRQFFGKSPFYILPDERPGRTSRTEPGRTADLASAEPAAECPTRAALAHA